ncbi:MAG TPA: protein kinase, partial [Polyangiaceae bacterium]|nr:protein kinase [Polyangiaceae bacterium]
FRKLVVLKEPLPELTSDPNFVKMFRNEARLAALLQHPNVVQTYDAWQLGPRHFLTMEYLEGQPMHRAYARLKPGGLSLRTRLYVLRGVLAALHYAHELCDYEGRPLGIVHRDVSPQNVFLGYDGQVKLVDFGIAKALGAPSNGTDSGAFKGKETYAAPEQLVCDRVDRRADLFAVGILLWEALTGSPFWPPGQPRLPLLRRRLQGQEPGVLDVAPTADPTLAAICAKAMAFSPDERFATAQAFLEALEGHAGAEASRAGAEELGAALRSAFADERSTMRSVIEKALRRAESSPEPAFATADSEALPPAYLSSSHPASAGPRRRHVAGLMATALAGLLVVGAGAQLAWRALSPGPPKTEPAVAVTPPPRPAASDAPEPGDLPAAAKASAGERDPSPPPKPSREPAAAPAPPSAGSPRPKPPRPEPGAKPSPPPKRRSESGLDETPYGP